MADKTIRELIKEYFSAHPNEDLEHGPVVDWVTEQWLETHKTPPRDPWRVIRALHQQGFLIKVSKGVYRHDPRVAAQRELEDFTPEQKEEIFKRDNYRCVICGRGRQDGYEIHADHIVPKDLGGKAEISNGQTLCSIHNFRKKNYKQTETGKKMFIRLYELSKSLGDEETMRFCEEILETFTKHHINDHIEWDR
ncbi:MAG: HNH endonuclease [Chloroflexi bacterium RBG_13_56_8]|nr:MAG: HNH endonuclease [Chloroflexi bacterium RBG_13_56_8]